MVGELRGSESKDLVILFGDLSTVEAVEEKATFTGDLSTGAGTAPCFTVVTFHTKLYFEGVCLFAF